MLLIFSIVVSLGLGVVFGRFLRAEWLNDVVIYDYCVGLRYKDGVFHSLLPPGRYWPLWTGSITVVDLRRTAIDIYGQDVLTKDNVSIKLSLAGSYRVLDAVKAVHSCADYKQDLGAMLQGALRLVVADLTLEETLAQRGVIPGRVLDHVTERAAAIGIDLGELRLRDVILTPALKRAFSGAVEARKDALRQLERTRGEKAVLRSLLNASRLYADHPQLFQARLAQELAGTRHTIVVRADGNCDDAGQPRKADDSRQG
jgi:regulator of protease activity HflC (stomatin/prohibitin superfamily)